MFLLLTMGVIVIAGFLGNNVHASDCMDVQQKNEAAEIAQTTSLLNAAYSFTNRVQNPVLKAGTGAGFLIAVKMLHEIRREHTGDQFNPGIPFKPLAEAQRIELCTHEIDARIAKAEKIEGLRKIAQSKREDDALKNQINAVVPLCGMGVQIIDNSVQKKVVPHKISLVDLVQRKTLVYVQPEAKKDRVKTPHSFDGIVSVSGNQVTAIGDNSFLVSSPSVEINENGQENIFLHTDQPLLMGTELQLEDGRLTLQEMPTSTMPKLF